MSDDDLRALDRQPADFTPPLRSTVAAPAADRRRVGRRLLGFGALLLLAAGLAIGVQQHYRQHLEVAAAAQEQRDFAPRVRVAAVQASPDIHKVVLPATTTAFEAANIFARASGYIAQRNRSRDIQLPDAARHSRPSGLLMLGVLPALSIVYVRR